ncbi:hypothetical protein ARMGADRAFT_1004928 [Armillaria gallica]|uniref:Uncharacterized protein n=1 Tax=Armillaria gallica TaxID=47427 RepID=A0A2H3F1B6_ARMGA|nr:hypothetical protein ARMGADRAFT_1004928 [Armillaria gallica]
MRQVINLGWDEKVVRVIYFGLTFRDETFHDVMVRNVFRDLLRFPSTTMSSSPHPVYFDVDKLRDELRGLLRGLLRDELLDGLLDGLLLDGLLDRWRLLDASSRSRVDTFSFLGLLGSTPIDRHLLLNRLLDRLLDRLLHPSLERGLHGQPVDSQVDRLEQATENALENAIVKSMVQRVRQYPEIAVKILHGLSGNCIVKDAKGDYHFKVIMDNYDYMVYKYAMDILMEGLFKNEDTKVTVYNFQLFNEVAMDYVRRLSNSPVVKDNIRLLPNPEDTETADKIRCRSLVERVEARIALNAGMVEKNAIAWKKTCAFRDYISEHKADTNKERYESVKELLVRHGEDGMMRDDLLRDFTSDRGIISDIRKKGNRAAHCEGTKEEMFVAAVKRQPKGLQPYMEEIRLVGRTPRKPRNSRKSRP